MERLTEERGERTWRWFHIGWYINFFCVIAFLGAAWCFLLQVASGASQVAGTEGIDIALMMGFSVIAAVLLMGAGVSRYQARTEGQHLELKMAINRLAAALEKMDPNAAKSKAEED